MRERHNVYIQCTMPCPGHFEFLRPTAVKPNIGIIIFTRTSSCRKRADFVSVFTVLVIPDKNWSNCRMKSLLSVFFAHDVNSFSGGWFPSRPLYWIRRWMVTWFCAHRSIRRASSIRTIRFAYGTEELHEDFWLEEFEVLSSVVYARGNIFFPRNIFSSSRGIFFDRIFA